MRTPLRGGCGKALMLTVFRIVLPAAFTPGVSCSFGSEVVDKDVVGVVYELDGARSPLLGKGVCNPAFESDDVGTAPVLFRVFVVGIAGNDVVGGPYNGREGLGMLAAML